MIDQEVLDEIQRAVLESPDSGATWPSGLWTLAEVLNYLNERQDRFLKETVLITSWLDLNPVTANQAAQNLPDGWLATRLAFYDDGAETRPLQRFSREEADAMLPGWETDYGIPLGYISEERATRQVLLVPPPDEAGILHLFAALVGNPMDQSGIDLTIPDEFAPYLYYGVLADMFAKQGRAFDPARRDYCEARFQEGVALAQALLRGVIMS